MRHRRSVEITVRAAILSVSMATARASRLRRFLGASLVLLSACGPVRLFVPSPAHQFHARAVTVAGATYRYQVYVPAERPAGAKLPVVVFLHGGGERGDDNIRQTQEGLGPVLWKSHGRFPFLVVFPQCRGRFWAAPEMEAQALAALDAAVVEWGGDPARVYLTGHSMGGYGTWVIGAHKPGRFAALVPVSGGVRPPPWLPITTPAERRGPEIYDEIARAIGQTPVWALHGADDMLVPARESRKLVAAMRRAGATPRYTEYADTGHSDAAEKAYNDPALWQWLLAQRLPERAAGRR